MKSVATVDLRPSLYRAELAEGVKPAAALADAYGPEGPGAELGLLDMAMFDLPARPQPRPEWTGAAAVLADDRAAKDAEKTNRRPLRSKRPSRSKVR